MVTTRMVRTSQMSNRGVLEGRNGPGIEPGQGVTKAVDNCPENCLVIHNTQKIASSYLVSS